MFNFELRITNYKNTFPRSVAHQEYICKKNQRVKISVRNSRN